MSSPHTEIPYLLERLVRIEEEQERTRLMLGKIHTHSLRNFRANSLHETELRIFSQFGDDGIIQYLVQKIRCPEIFIEFGVSNYLESNTRFLLMNNNWRGLVMDGSEENIRFLRRRPWFWRHDIKAVSEFITKDNINKIIMENGYVGEIGLLHIDLDGNDYWILSEISVINPCILILEYNSVFGKKMRVSVPYDENFQRSAAHHSNLYFGASLGALADLAEKRGYTFVGCNSAGNNAYFVRKDLVGDLPQPSLADGYVESRFRESRGLDGTLTYLSGDQRLAAIADKSLHDISTGNIRTIKDLYGL